MKRFTWTIALLLLVSMLAGCGVGTATTDKNDDKTGTGNKPSNGLIQGDLSPGEGAKKFIGTVLASSQFADGLAVVIGNGDTYGTFIINNKGEIVADLGEKLGEYQPDEYDHFSNGLMLLCDLLIDSKGNVTRPEDVDVTKFYDVAFSGGYILAEVTEATYDSTKMKLGIMNTDFQWVLEPTEELYNAVGEKALEETGLIDSRSYYYDGYIYFGYTGMFLNVTSGKTFTKENAPFAHPSQFWIPHISSYKVPLHDGHEKMLDLYQKGNVGGLSKFENGVAGIFLGNMDAQKLFMTLIDEKGNFLFEPVDVGLPTGQTSMVVIEGESIFVYQCYYSSSRHMEGVIKKYDLQGNFLGEFYTNSVDSVNNLYDIYIDGGVIILQWNTFSSGNYSYFTTDFEPLFQSAE